MEHQDHKVVVLRKKRVYSKESQSDQSVNKAIAMGQSITTKTKQTGNSNSSQNVDSSTHHKLDNATDGGKHKKVTLSLGKAIMQARTAKEMSQKDFATKINEKPQVVNTYEQGKAIPNHQILMKMQRVLGVKLTCKDICSPINKNKKK